nr:hypothetical protein asmbl_22 [uncultured bacterium]
MSATFRAGTAADRYLITQCRATLSAGDRNRFRRRHREQPSRAIDLKRT